MQNMDMDKALGVIWMFLLAAGVIVSLLWYSGTVPLRTEEDVLAYSNAQLGVALKYPSSWELDERAENRYVGQNGFFGVDAVAASDEMTVELLAREVVNHKLRPYGTSPRMVRFNVAGQEARLIFPSKDQEQKTGVLIVDYPRPVTVGDETYSFFVLYADAAHLQSLAESVTFLRK